jgi:predicted DNA-binding ribbon-helix-helix protein
MIQRTVQKRSIKVAGHPTSISLEASFWDALREIAAKQQISANELIERIDANRNGNLSSAIREFVLLEYRKGGRYPTEADKSQEHVR